MNESRIPLAEDSKDKAKINRDNLNRTKIINLISEAVEQGRTYIEVDNLEDVIMEELQAMNYIVTQQPAKERPAAAAILISINFHIALCRIDWSGKELLTNSK